MDRLGSLSGISPPASVLGRSRGAAYAYYKCSSGDLRDERRYDSSAADSAQAGSQRAWESGETRSS